MGDDLLVAEKIRVAVGGRPLFDELTFTVRPGDLVEIRGPNGSGKSTLLRCLVGLHEPDAGEIRRSAESVYIGHRSGICARMTPIENLRWLVGVARVQSGSESLVAALRRVGLGAAAYDLCGELSAGQERRVALARLLVCPARLWFLDEPLTALDDAGRNFICELLDGHRSAGGAAVCATHGSLSTTRDLAAARIVALGS